MQNSLIADIRAVNLWDYVTPEWDGVTIPKPKAQLMPVSYEIQIRKMIVGEDGQPALSDWLAIPVENVDISKMKSGLITNE
jgi:hypothetical protein